MTDDSKTLHEQWDQTYDQLQFWMGVHEKALSRAQGDHDDAAVRFARTKRDEAEASHDKVFRRLSSLPESLQGPRAPHKILD